jgi:hypothetical protein
VWWAAYPAGSHNRSQTDVPDQAEIEVWGRAQAATVQVLEAAPIELEKQPCHAPVLPRERELGGSDDLWNQILGSET